METLQVQSAGAAAPTPSGSIVSSGAPSGDDSFASTLGRALGNMPGQVQGASAVAPNVSWALGVPSRGKVAARNRTDSASTAGTPLNCILTDLLPPTPSVARSAEVEPTSDSSLDFASPFNAAAGETTANGGAFTSPGAAAASAISTWASIAVASMGTATPASSKSATAARGQTASQFSGSASTTGQKLSKDTSASQPAIAAASPLGLQATLTLTQPTGSQPQGAQADSDPVRAASPWSMQDSGGVQAAPASTGFTDSSPHLETFDCAQTLAASVPSAERSDSSTPVVATDDPQLAESSILPGKLGGAEAPAASNPRASSVQPGQSGFSKGSQAADSTALGSGPTSSTEQVGQEAATVRLGTIEVAPQALATGREDMAELSDALGNFAGAQISASVVGSESQPDEFATRVNPVAAPQAASLATAAGNATLHSAVVLGSEAARQQLTDPKLASAQAASSASASPAAFSQLDANPQLASSPTPLPKDAAAGASAIPPGGASHANSSGGSVHTSSADSSPSNGKSGQQNGQTSDDNPASAIPIAHSSLGNAAPDPTANLLGVHAPAATVTHTNTSAPQAAPSPSAPATTLSAWQNYDGGAGSLVRSASLSGSANGAEMHVEFRSGALGPLEVHTVMHDGSVGAEIHVQGQEAHTLLAAGLPSLERALSARNVRVENIAVYQDQAGGGMSGGGKQDSGSSPSPRQQGPTWNSLPQPAPAASGSAQDEDSANPAAGLSVRA